MKYSICPERLPLIRRSDWLVPVTLGARNTNASGSLLYCGKSWIRLLSITRPACASSVRISGASAGDCDALGGAADFEGIIERETVADAQRDSVSFKVRKPGEATVTLYSPGISPVRLKCPSAVRLGVDAHVGGDVADSHCGSDYDRAARNR